MTKNNPKILTHFLARKVFVQTLVNYLICFPVVAALRFSFEIKDLSKTDENRTQNEPALLEETGNQELKREAPNEKDGLQRVTAQ
jgi:hypothetical protein